MAIQLSDEQKEAATKMYQDGFSLFEIAISIDSSIGTIKKYLNNEGISKECSSKRLTAEEEQQILDIWNSGEHSIKKIALAVRRSSQAVISTLDRACVVRERVRNNCIPLEEIEKYEPVYKLQRKYIYKPKKVVGTYRGKPYVGYDITYVPSWFGMELNGKERSEYIIDEYTVKTGYVGGYLND